MWALLPRCVHEERELTTSHMGESRAKRLREFLQENDAPILALREGASVLVEGETATLLGPARTSEQVTWQGARVVRTERAGGACEVVAGQSLQFLMDYAGDSLGADETANAGQGAARGVARYARNGMADAPERGSAGVRSERASAGAIARLSSIASARRPARSPRPLR